MASPLTTSVCALAVLTAAGHPIYGQDQGEPNLQNHPSLQRAFAESPQADKDANGALSLEEYAELIKHERPRDPENPKAPLLPVRANGDLVVHDFEDNNVAQAPKWSPVPHLPLKDHALGWHLGGNWVREGTAFNRDLTTATKMMKRRVGPFEGKFFVTSITEGEAATGRLISTAFLIEQDFLLITMSGGKIPGRICANLHLSEGIVRSATGNNDDYFEKVALDVREFRGQLAKIELLDNHQGLWGHLNVDEILMTSQPGAARLVKVRPTPLVATGGIALTAKGQHRGSLHLENGQLTCAGKPVSDELLLAINPQNTAPPPHKGAVHLIDGEIWRADVLNVEGVGRKKTLHIRSNIFQEQKVALSKIASMEFVAGAPDAPRQPETFYRSDGDPLTGKLIWVRAKDIAIRSPLGVIPIPRASSLRYVLAKPAPPAAERKTDEIGLMDGSLIFGTTKFEGNQLLIVHEVLGELNVTWDAVRYLRRNKPGLVWLDSAKRTVMESIGPALPPPAPKLTSLVTGNHLRSLRIMPHSVVRLALPSPHSPGRFQGQLHLVPGNQANLKVTILDGNSPVWSQQLKAGSKPIPLSLNLSNAEELTLKVEFDGPLAFPCGIDLRDAHVLRTNPLKAE